MPKQRKDSGKKLGKANQNVREYKGYKWAVSEADAKRRAEQAMAISQEELDCELQTAIRFRDMLYAKAILATGANPNFIGVVLKSSALGYAIESGSIEAVELLLCSGANPNVRTGLTTPLSLAIFERQWQMADLILKAGADPNLISSIRVPSLHLAVEYSSNIPLVESLILNGAKLDTKDVHGLTPLDWARRKRKKRMIELIERAVRLRHRKSKVSKPRKAKK